MLKVLLILGNALLLGSLVLYSGCSGECGDHLCDPPVSGATSAGGAGQTGSSTNGGGGGGPCGACSDPTPLCDESTNTCVACLASTDCSDPSASKCDAGSCVPCEDSRECTHIEGAGVCDAGACVECTAENRSACGTFVCDGSSNTCTTRPEHSKDNCGDCVADAECMAGRVCVVMTLDSTNVGQFCQWQQAARPPGPDGVCNNVRPYAGVEPVTTIDDASTTICTLDLTTCAAVDDYSAETPCSGDDECGDPTVDDGLCRFNAGAAEDTCTIPCIGNSDCPPGANCEAGFYCTL
jgi:hypothetical protein